MQQSSGSEWKTFFGELSGAQDVATMSKSSHSIQRLRRDTMCHLNTCGADLANAKFGDAEYLQASTSLSALSKTVTIRHFAGQLDCCLYHCK